MKGKVLVLGAGMVARPLVKYLLNNNFYVSVASRTLSKAEKIIENHPNGEAIAFDIEKNINSLKNIVRDCDIAVSLLPPAHHVSVAKQCIRYRKHLVTTSYVSREMRSLDKEAKEVGVLLLNECGLDPGIDHMSAMRLINRIRDRNGKVVSFKSTTGALPYFEANNNPFGYKFSWSPRGVLLASRNPAKWLENGKIVSVPGEKLFENYYLQDIPGIGTFENYPNRDSLQYREIYGLKDAKTVYRGTFRLPGWCETLYAIANLGWLQDKPIKNFHGKTYGDITRKFVKAKKNENLEIATARFLGLKEHSSVIKKLSWLGLFSEKNLPSDKNNPLDYLTTLMLEKLQFSENEVDMIVMHHELIAQYEDKKEYITSTLFEKGEPKGDSAVSRTVALPAAIAVKMIMNKCIDLKGVVIPTIPDLYNPILDELEKLGIKFHEKIEILEN